MTHPGKMVSRKAVYRQSHEQRSRWAQNIESPIFAGHEALRIFAGVKVWLRNAICKGRCLLLS